MSATDEVLQANNRYASQFNAGNVPRTPARRLAVVTCMDARLHPETFLGLHLGDAHVIRNAGGRVSDDVLRSLIVSSHVLSTREIMVIHHTDCGMVNVSNDDLRRQVQEATGQDASGIDFRPITDPEDGVRQDVRALRESPFLSKDISVRGFVYDVHTGQLSEIRGA